METAPQLQEIPQETKTWFNGDVLRARTFLEKYALRNEDGVIVEKTPQEMWQRIAREVSSADVAKNPPEYFYSLLEDFKFIPGGRIMFAVGQPRKATPLNCYVLPIKEDSLESIFEWCGEAARTYALGGGVGTDISVLRPRGAPVNNSAVTSTGAVSFMDLLSQVTGTIGQSGRRGAQMTTIDVSHPDILDFIKVKSDKDRRNVKFSNISVKVTDEFMQAVEADADFDLIYDGKIFRTVRAREIWDALTSRAHSSAEPGVLFWDTIRRDSPTEYNDMNVHTTNPCGEQPLNKYGNCCLGSINLSKLVRKPFTPDAYFDFAEFAVMVEKGMVFLDSVIDYAYEKHPLPAQAKTSLETRRTGLGVTALGDMFFKLGLEYGGLPSMKLTREIFLVMRDVAYKTSIERARAFGAFEKFNPTYHLAMGFTQRLPHDVQHGILNYGLRNACLLTIPPVGTGSVLAGCSSGIEPIFAASYTRRSETLSQEYYDVDHDIVSEYKSVKNDWPPPYFKTAHDIDPLVRVQMQALIQEYIDSSISSTVNLSEDTPVDAVERIYMEAWRRGCKGITVYREGSREGILITKDSVTVEKSYRADDLAGRTFKTRTGYGNLYITVNTDVDNNPLEVFIHIGKSGFSTTADAEALGRMISLALRRHTPVDEIVRQLEDIGSDRPVFSNGGLVKSVPDAVAQVLEKYIKDKEVKERPQSAPFANVPDFCRRPMECLARYEGGCLICHLCGESKC